MFSPEIQIADIHYLIIEEKMDLKTQILKVGKSKCEKWAYLPHLPLRTELMASTVGKIRELG